MFKSLQELAPTCFPSSCLHCISFLHYCCFWWLSQIGGLNNAPHSTRHFSFVHCLFTVIGHYSSIDREQISGSQKGLPTSNQTLMTYICGSGEWHLAIQQNANPGIIQNRLLKTNNRTDKQKTPRLLLWQLEISNGRGKLGYTQAPHQISRKAQRICPATMIETEMIYRGALTKIK